MAEQRSAEPDPLAEALVVVHRALDFLLGQEIERSRTGVSRAETYGRAERLRDELRRVAAPQP